MQKFFRSLSRKFSEPQRVVLEWIGWVLLAIVVFFACFYLAKAIERANFDDSAYQPATGDALDFEYTAE